VSIGILLLILIGGDIVYVLSGFLKYPKSWPSPSAELGPTAK